MQKPLGIKIIAGFLVVWAVFLLWLEIGIYKWDLYIHPTPGSRGISYLLPYLLLSLLLITCGVGLWNGRKWAWIGSMIIFTLIPVSVIVNSFVNFGIFGIFDLQSYRWVYFDDPFWGIYEPIAKISDLVIPVASIIYLLNQRAQEIPRREFWKIAIFVFSSAVMIVSINMNAIKEKQYADRVREAENARVSFIANHNPQCPDGKYLIVDKENRIASAHVSYGYERFTYIGYLSGNHIELDKYKDLNSEPKCYSEQSCFEYMRQCKDRNNKTIFDNYHLVVKPTEQ